MSVLVVLIGLSIAILIGAGAVLFWAVDHGQFDDMDTPGLLPLADADEDDPAARGRCVAVRGDGRCAATRRRGLEPGDQARMANEVEPGHPCDVRRLRNATPNRGQIRV